MEGIRALTGHLSDAATQELLAPITADGAWPERSSHWLPGALGEAPHVARLGPDATVADWARSHDHNGHWLRVHGLMAGDGR